MIHLTGYIEALKMAGLPIPKISHGLKTSLSLKRGLKMASGVSLLWMAMAATQPLVSSGFASVFAPLKSRYRSAISKLSSLDDASRVKNQRFVTCYNLACEETFIPRLLRVGWKAAEIHPFEPLKGLNFSQVQASKPRPSTPPPQQKSTLCFSPLRALTSKIKLPKQFAKRLARNKLQWQIDNF
ncbi:hypothetical protein E4T42_09555 [Aureobasidium subglaciale]|nr:hypothetical protein E4T42_09555 [Aureobasidium subglaciale]